MELPHLHFKILALASFGAAETISQNNGSPLPVDRLSLDGAMQQIGSRCFLPLEKDICPDGGLELGFPSIKSLHPDGVLKIHPFIDHLHEAVRFIDQSRRQGKSATNILSGLHQWPDLPSMDIKESAPATKPASKGSSLDNLLNMVALGDQKEIKPDASANPALETLRQVMARLFAHPGFNALESSWRGLRFLLQHGVLEENIRVEIAPVHSDTLEQDLEALTPALINDLPGVILLDLGFDNTPLAMEKLAAAAAWAAQLMVPLVAWVGPDFLQIPAWEKLGTLPFIPSHLESPPFAKFRSLKGSAEADWLCLTCNRFLVRYPYGTDNQPRQIPFDEPGPLWVSPVWAFGTLLAQSMGKTGWPTRLTDPRICSLEDLALIAQEGQRPTPSEALLNSDRLDQFARAGLTPLAAESGRDKAFFPRAVTLQGNAMAYQLLLSQVTRLVLWCKDNLPAETSEISLQTQLKMAFQVFSEQSQPPGFADVAITTQPPGADGRIPVTFHITPAASILPNQQAITLNIEW